MTLAIRDQLPAGSIYILCAAVSDFLPKQTPSHKIHTSDRLEL
jgi:phosphopantothenoylcysteine synthetase/decarboxylase